MREPTIHELPRYFHLLSDRELRSIQPMFLGLHRDAALDRWGAAYGEHFGAARTLDGAAFRECYGRDLDAVIRLLATDDREGFEAQERNAGEGLASRGVPFAEVAVSIHLLDEFAADLFTADSYRHRAFDKLSLVRVVLMATAYSTRGNVRPPTAQIPTLAQAEIDLIHRALEATGNNKVKAARILSISRHRLYDKLRKTDGAPPIIP